MSEPYFPELGQAVFGQPHQAYKVPDIMDAVLCYIRDRLDTVMWNVTQAEYPSPFGNTGNQFVSKTFSAFAYSWGDEPQEYNFAWRDLRISWYKYLGRGMSANKQISPELAAECLADCIRSLDELDNVDWSEEAGSA